jgi:hypothetical protein
VTSVDDEGKAGGGTETAPDGECPFATTAEVSEAMGGREMDLTLSSATDCEWLQEENTAVSASVSIVDPELGETFNDRDAPPVSDIGDEAYQDANGLYLRAGGKELEVICIDLNGDTGLDAEGATRKLAMVVATRA